MQVSLHGVLYFLKRDVNVAYAKATGGKINRGAGYELEIPVYIGFMDPDNTLIK